MKTRLKIHNITAFITAALVIITGISLAACCIAIYVSGGDQPFSREAVGKYLKYVMIQGVATLELVIFGIVLKFAFPLDKEKLRAKPNILVTRKKLTEKLQKRDEILLRTDEKINREKKYRKKMSLGLASIITALGIASILFATLIDYSVSDINGYVIKVSVFAFSLAFIGGGLIYAYDILSKKSYKREIDALKSLLVIANSDVPAPEMPETKDRKPALVNLARVSIITVAVAFIVLGIFNGGMSDVLGKAVRICTECIGLG
ncbi:MAG: hypothetical protein IJD79_01440 [Clostridia bacterium]|nr:hypothetical protein [Clostridia bacterium]